MSFYLSFLFLLVVTLSLFSISLEETIRCEFGLVYYPDPWAIEDIGTKKFKPYDDQHKNNPSLINSTENNKSCFGNGEGKEYSVAPAPTTSLYSDTDEIFKLLPAIRDQIDVLVDQYLSKYCKSKKCGLMNCKTNTSASSTLDQSQPPLL